MTDTLPAPTFEKHSPIDGFTLEEANQLLERTCRALERWGTPVKEYVLTQNVHKKLNAERTSQLVAYGAQRGYLESWTVSPYPHRPKMLVRMVGLPKHNRVISNGTLTRLDNILASTRPAGTFWDTEQATQDHLRQAQAPLNYRQRNVIDNIRRQYDGLSDETKREIIALLTDPVASRRASTKDIQRAYRLMAGTIGLVKREFGLKTHTNPHKTKTPQHADTNPKPATSNQQASATPTPIPSDPLSEAIQKRLMEFTSSGPINGPGTYIVHVLKAAEITIPAESAEQAIAIAKTFEGVSDIVSIRRT